MQTLENHKDLGKQFKRFLPDDDEDELSIERALFNQFGQNLFVDEENDNTYQDVLQQEISRPQKLKKDALTTLLKLLKEYTDAKIQKPITEALQLYGDKVMHVAETYARYVNQELRSQLKDDI